MADIGQLAGRMLGASFGTPTRTVSDESDDSESDVSESDESESDDSDSDDSDSDDSESDDSRTKILDEYRTVIETEIERICDEILEIIDGLVKGSDDTEPKVFYLKMKGDYLRYLAEFQVTG